MLYHQGRLLDHVHLTVRDFERAQNFYTAIFSALNLGSELRQGRDWCEIDELYIEGSGQDRLPSHVHLCFQATDRQMVHRFHEAGVQNGGRDNGAPALRDYHQGYFAAFLLDPDGNNIEAKLDERMINRSARSVISSDVPDS